MNRRELLKTALVAPSVIPFTAKNNYVENKFNDPLCGCFVFRDVHRKIIVDKNWSAYENSICAVLEELFWAPVIFKRDKRQHFLTHFILVLGVDHPLFVIDESEFNRVYQERRRLLAERCISHALNSFQDTYWQMNNAVKRIYGEFK
jgi:hypothetical protein